MKSSPSSRRSLPPRHLRPATPWSVRLKKWGRWLLVLFVVGYGVSWGYDFWTMTQELERVQAQEQELVRRQEQLRQDEARYQDREQIEKEAREQLGLVKENEVPYIR